MQIKSFKMQTHKPSLLKASKEEALTEKQRIIESAKNDIDQYVYLNLMKYP